MDSLVFSLILCLGLLTPARGKPAELPTTCNAPSARKGDKVILVCSFHTAVSAIASVNVAVDHYGTGSTNPDEVASCTNVFSSGFKCETKRAGYTFRMAKDPAKVELEIAHVTPDDAGRFVCKLMSPDIDLTRPEPCQLTVSGGTDSENVKENLGVKDTTEGEASNTKDPQDDRTEVETSPNEAVTAKDSDQSVIIEASAGVVAILIVATVVALVYFLLRRKRRRTSCKDTEKGKQFDSSSDGSSPPRTPASVHKNESTIQTKEETNPLLGLQGKNNPCIEEEAAKLEDRLNPGASDQTRTERSVTQDESHTVDAKSMITTTDDVSGTREDISTSETAHSNPQPLDTSGPTDDDEEEAEHEDTIQRQRPMGRSTMRKKEKLERWKKLGIAVGTLPC